MFSSIWRRLWNQGPVPAECKARHSARHLSFRPRLEPLEDRLAPAAMRSGLFAIEMLSGSVHALPQSVSKRTGTAPISVVVASNSSETVINLGPVFAAVNGLEHGDGLTLSILGNTNSQLVHADLSEASLTLTYTRGRSGKATITVCATDADGVSVQKTILVTVRSTSPVVAISGSPPSTSLPVPTSPAPRR
jgi:hypothetical protein